MIYIQYFIEWRARFFRTYFSGFKDSAQHAQLMKVYSELRGELTPYEQFFETQAGKCEVYDEDNIPIDYDDEKEASMGAELAEKMIEVKKIYQKYFGDNIFLEDLDDSIECWTGKPSKRFNCVFSSPHVIRDIKTFYDFSGLEEEQKLLAEKQLKELLNAVSNPFIECKNYDGGIKFDTKNGRMIYQNLPAAIDYFTKIRDILANFPNNKVDLAPVNRFIDALNIDNQDSKEREFIRMIGTTTAF
ncbi:MAG: hypothetical protein MJZ34_14420 [Paludibacteraceae bacterium]|nr:hypothetical protein [Paludibacteraceae bacterium]